MPATSVTSLSARGVILSLGATIYDPADPMGKMFFNILATFAEFEVDLLRTLPATSSRSSSSKVQSSTSSSRLSGTRSMPIS